MKNEQSVKEFPVSMNFKGGVIMDVTTPAQLSMVVRAGERYLPRLPQKISAATVIKALNLKHLCRSILHAFETIRAPVDNRSWDS